MKVINKGQGLRNYKAARNWFDKNYSGVVFYTTNERFNIHTKEFERVK